MLVAPRPSIRSAYHERRGMETKPQQAARVSGQHVKTGELRPRRHAPCVSAQTVRFMAGIDARRSPSWAVKGAEA